MILAFVFYFEFVFEQRVANSHDMLGAGGFEDQLDFGLTDRHLAETAALADLQYVRAQVGDALGQPRQTAAERGTPGRRRRTTPAAALRRRTPSTAVPDS